MIVVDSLNQNSIRDSFQLLKPENLYTDKGNFIQCANIGFQFIPLAFESFGGLSDLVRKTLK